MSRPSVIDAMISDRKENARILELVASNLAAAIIGKSEHPWSIEQATKLHKNIALALNGLPIDEKDSIEPHK